MTYVGNYVINKSNIVKQYDKTYRLTHSDAMLSIRDKTLNRGKRLFAKIQACNIDTVFNGKITVSYYKLKGIISDELITREYYITFDLCKGDLLNKINEHMDKLYEIEQYKLFIRFINHENKRTKIYAKMDNDTFTYAKFVFDETLSDLLGFEPNIEYKYPNAGDEILSPHPSMVSTNVIYFTHANLIHSNFNKDNITAVSHHIEQQINYEVMFEIRSLSPSVNIEFFIYIPKDVDSNVMVKKRIFPSDVCIILGFYEDEY